MKDKTIYMLATLTMVILVAMLFRGDYPGVAPRFVIGLGAAFFFLVGCVDKAKKESAKEDEV